MKNLGGCGALLGFAGLLCAVLVYWSNWGQWLPPGAQESAGRLLTLGVGAMFLVTLVVVLGAPMGRGGGR